MKKALLIAAAALLLGTVGATFAQSLSPKVVGPGIAGSGTSKADVTAQHQVFVHIPTLVLLQIQGSGNADVQFSPTADEIYYHTSTAIAPNSASAAVNPSTFTKVRGFTNGTSDVKVTATVATDATGTSVPATDGTILGNLELGGSSLAGGVTKNISGSTSPAWTDLWTLNQFGLVLSGTETPGTYSYTVTYTATVP